MANKTNEFYKSHTLIIRRLGISRACFRSTLNGLSAERH